MNERFLMDLLALIEAIIDEKISRDHGRDSLNESVRVADLLRDFLAEHFTNSGN